MRKVGQSEEADMEVENSENESFDDNAKKNSELSDLNLETNSILEKE